MGSYSIKAGGLVLGAAILAGGFFAAPARAGDDGQAPIWTSLYSMIGTLGPEPDPIDYRERSKLVLPPKADLPPPAPSAVGEAAGWPLDPDLDKRNKERERLRTYVTRSPTHDKTTNQGRPLSPDQLRSEGPVLASDPNGPRCRRDPGECHYIPPSILEKFGIVKEKDTIVAGQEPGRDWLTDPPKGYRMPYKNTKATFDTKPHIDESDPRTSLFVNPDK
jgi:hypothetical protein